MTSELSGVAPDYTIWHAYDRNVKAELFSTAIQSPGEIVAIDPIPLAAPVRSALAITAAVLTNANHVRAVHQFASGEKIFVPAELRGDFPGARILTDDSEFFGLRAIAIAGAAPGEFALHDPRHGGTLIFGDALINFGSNGFNLLPAKYCLNQKQMIRSLHRLSELPLTRMFFAHGEPITVHAGERFRALLQSCS
jgi:glyoxylase-like metal-dependent hydrolase (beta-lactamase superfamily II)